MSHFGQALGVGSGEAAGTVEVSEVAAASVCFGDRSRRSMVLTRAATDRFE